MKKNAILLASFLILLIIMMQYNKVRLKSEYEQMAYESAHRAVKIIEDYKEYEKTEELFELIGELSIFSVSIDKLEKYDSDIEYCNDIEKTKSILISKQKQIVGIEYLYEGLLAIEGDIYSDIGYSYLNSFVNENMVK